MRLADIAMIQGDTALSVELERNSSAYKDSLYKFRRSVVVSEMIEVETDVQTMFQKLYYEDLLNTYLCIYIPVVVIIVVVTFFLYKRYQRKNDLLQKDKQQLEKVNQDLSQHSTNLQADIAEKDLEIEGLKKELASHQIDEEQRKKYRQN